MKKRYVFFIVIVILIILLTIILLNINKKEEKKDGYKIVTSFYPIYVMALNITEGASNIELVNMTDQSVGCLHDYTLNTSDMKKLENSNVLLQNGLGLENFINKITQSYSNIKILDTSENITNKIKDGENVNPHIWTSVENYIRQVEHIQEFLSKENNENANTYNENTKSYIKQLNDIKTKFYNNLQNLNGRKALCLNESFEYLAKDIKLDLLSIHTDHDESTLSADTLKDIINKMKQDNIKIIIVDVNDNLKNAQTIAHETGAQIYTLNSAITGNISKNAYIDIMNSNYEILKQIK